MPPTLTPPIRSETEERVYIASKLGIIIIKSSIAPRGMSFFSTEFTSPIPQSPVEMPSRKRKGDELSDQVVKKQPFNKDHYDAADLLPVNMNLPKINNNDIEKRMAFWFYILSLLMDTQNKHMIAWTGKGREFFIHSPNELAAGWCRYQGNEKVKWQSVLRLFRLQTERGIITRLGPRGGHHTMLLFAFITEPSVHIGYTREELDRFIADNKVPQPTGFPIYPSSSRSPSKIRSSSSSRSSSTPSSTTSSSEGILRASESPDSVIPLAQPIMMPTISPSTPESTLFNIPPLFPFYPLTIPDLYSPFFVPPTFVEKPPVAQHKFSIDSILGL